MRLTRCLYKMRWRLHKKVTWHNKAIYKPMDIPPVAKDLNLNLVHIEDYLYPKSTEKWKPPPGDRRYITLQEPVPETEREDYHEEPLYQLSNTHKLSEGIKQAGVLTKTQIFEGLPPQVQSLIGKASIKDQDLLVQRAIYQSQVWDPTEEKLPKYFDRENLKYKYRRFHGIPNGRSALILLNNLIRLAQGFGGQFPSVASDRRYIYKPSIETVYHHNGSQIRVSGEYECLMLGKSPLQPLGDRELVNRSTEHKLFDMYPVLPTIDLVPCNNYTIREHAALKSGNVPTPYPLTMFRTMNVYWRPDIKQAYNIMFCFAVAAQEARRLYGPDVKVLPEPITIQNINMDWTTLNFLCFQLNTLDTNNDNGVKNLAWCDNNNKLFSKIYPKPWKEEEMWKKMRYEDYSKEVFKKFLAVFLNGASEVQS